MRGHILNWRLLVDLNLIIYGRYKYRCMNPTVQMLIRNIKYTKELNLARNLVIISKSIVGSLVKWLREETHNQEVVSAYLGSSYEMHIFTLICCKILLYWSKRTKNQRERGRAWPIFTKSITKWNMQTEKISLINYRRVKFNFPKHVLHAELLL